jgi:hypothetical protein
MPPSYQRALGTIRGPSKVRCDSLAQSGELAGSNENVQWEGPAMSLIVSRHGSLILAFAILLVGADYAAACGNGKLILEDKFETLDPAWKVEKNYNKLTTGPGGLSITIAPGNDVGALSHSGSYENFEICAAFITEGIKGTDDLFAIRFWTSDGNDEYWAVIWTERSWFKVNRYENDEPKAITSQIEDSSLLNKPGPTNEASIRLNDKKGTFSVNGKKVADFTGQPPEGDSTSPGGDGSAVRVKLSGGRDGRPAWASARHANDQFETESAIVEEPPLAKKT